MKILVTGSSGFFGKEILSKLVNNNTFTLNRKEGNFQFDLSKGVPIFNISFDLVIHNAGKAHCVPKTENDKKEYHNINVLGTKNLLKALETKPPKQFVFISSVSVYGEYYGININELHTLNAKDPYGLSKIEAEKIVQNWCWNHNVTCTILRIPLLVGKRPIGNLGAMLQAIYKGYYFNIEGGSAKKSMVLAEDVAIFIPKIAIFGGVFNLTDGLHPTFKELSRAIAKKKIFNLPLFIAKPLSLIGDLVGSNFPINSIKLRKITSDLTFDDSKARDLGWEPKSILKFLENNDL